MMKPYIFTGEKKYVIFILLYFSVSIPASPYLFYSNFENGISSVLRGCKQGQKYLTVVPNSDMDQWPDSGFGVISFDNYELKEFFHYKKCENNIFHLKTPLKKSHSFGEDLRTSNFSSWTNDINVSIDTGNAVFGQFGVKVVVKQDLIAELQKELPVKNDIYLNYYVRVSKELMDNTRAGRGLVLSALVPFGITVTIFKKGKINDPCYFSLLTSDSRRLTDSIAVAADSAYCLQTGYLLLKEKSEVVCKFWVNGRYIGEIIHNISPKLLESLEKIQFHLGNSTMRGNGFLFFDEIRISEKYISVKPNAPQAAWCEAVEARIQLVSSSFKSLNSQDRHILSQWLIGRNDNFRVPLFNSGITSTALTEVLLPGHLDLSGNLNWRVRHYANSGIWSDWSNPAPLNIKGYSRVLPKWLISDIQILGDNNRQHPKERIEKGKWYDILIKLDEGNIWNDISFIDLWLEYSDNQIISPQTRASAIYNPQTRYWVSLSVGDTSLWAKTIKGTSQSSCIVGSNGPFWQDSLSQYEIDRKKGRIKIRMRLLQEAKDGLWISGAFLKKRDGYISPVFRKYFIVGETPKKKSGLLGRIGYNYVIFLFVLLLVFIMVVLLRRIKFSFKSPGIPAAVPSRKQELMEKAYSFINENYHIYDLSRKQVAAHLLISERYLAKLFKQIKNENVTNYINALRVEKSRDLLIKTDKKIIDIAMEVGFTDSSYFIKIFRIKEGLTPGEYRKKSQIQG
ncbi:MAG: helix-turn-helix transcriptional regulator [bacterium]